MEEAQIKLLYVCSGKYYITLKYTYQKPDELCIFDEEFYSALICMVFSVTLTH